MYIQKIFPKRIILLATIFTFLLAQSIGPGLAFAQKEDQDQSEVLVSQTEPFNPVTIQGINIDYNDALKINFLINKGDTGVSDEKLKTEAKKLIKYFLASLAIPEDEMWVNLSIYEEDRIIPEDFGKTEMGSDLLAQDYLLKKVMSSMMYPDSELGKKFWNKVYARAKEEFGITDIPLDTFNKVWIVASDAQIYEHASGAFVIGSHMKVMLEEDYLALELSKQKSKSENYPFDKNFQPPSEKMSKVTSELLKKIIIPELEKEVNQGELFANLRQIYNSMILASWYKTALKESLLGQIYVDKGKTDGVEVTDKEAILKTYNNYVQSVKKGVYTYIKEEYDTASKEIIARKYFSGGVSLKAPKIAKMSRERINKLNPEDFSMITAELKSTGYIENPDSAKATTGAVQKKLIDSIAYLDNLQKADSLFQGLYYNGILIAQKSQIVDTAMTATVEDLKNPGAGFLGSEAFATFMNTHFPDADKNETIVDIVTDTEGNVFVTGPDIETGVIKLPSTVKKEFEVSETPILQVLFYWPQQPPNNDDEEEGGTSLFYNGVLIATSNEFVPQTLPNGTATAIPIRGTFNTLLAQFLNTYKINPKDITAQQEEGTNNWFIYGPPITNEKKILPPKKIAKNDLGGIDLHPENLNMKIEKDADGGIMPIAPQVIENINIKGFTPVIIEVAPVTNLPVLIGFKEGTGAES